jgi:hypothetical protein
MMLPSFRWYGLKLMVISAIVISKMLLFRRAVPGAKVSAIPWRTVAPGAL